MDRTIQCGLCSKMPVYCLRIVKCNHIYCTVCLLNYLKIRKFCPICVPYKKKKDKFFKKYFLNYIHPIRVFRKIKKHNKKVKRKHLIPFTERTNEFNQAVEIDDQILSNENSIDVQDSQPILDYKKVTFTPITVEKNQTNFDLNNNLSDEFNNLDKYERIRELIVKNENLRLFLEKINKIQSTMSSFHKLNELNKLISELTQNQSELRNESDILKKQIDQLNELNTKLDKQIEIKNVQDLIVKRTNSVNNQFKVLICEYREHNLELKKNYEKLLDGLSKNLNFVDSKN